MSRLLGIVHMNPEKSRSEWGHEEVSPVEISQLYKYGQLSIANQRDLSLNTQSFISIRLYLQEDIYGLGAVRTPEKFYETFGIDVFKKKAQKHLCRFVADGKMHRMFMPKLRSDGMGIDYATIKYKHKG